MAKRASARRIKRENSPYGRRIPKDEISTQEEASSSPKAVRKLSRHALLRKLRKDRRLSQMELATMAGLSRDHLGRIERGDEQGTLGTWAVRRGSRTTTMT